MSSESFLLQLPEIPMKMVLDELDFPAIMSLRKTCVDLRNTIEDLKPGPSDLQVEIHLKKDTVDFNLRWPVTPKPEDPRWKRNRQGQLVRSCEDTLHLIYQKVAGNVWSGEKSCQITCELPDPLVPAKTRVLKNSNFLDVFCNDLKIIMKHQKPTVIFKNFILIADKDCEKKTKKLYENLKNIFEARKFKIHDLRLHTFGDQEVFSILPYLDAEKLEQIVIQNAVDSYSRDPLERMDELMSLEHWKKLKDLLILGFSNPLKIQNLFHFTTFGIPVSSISTRDIIAMKDNMLAGSALESGSIHFQTMEDDWQILNDLFGGNRMAPHPEFPTGAVWEIPVPGEDSMVVIMFNDGYVSFRRQRVVVPMNVENPGNPGNPGNGGRLFGGPVANLENLENVEIAPGMFVRPNAGLMFRRPAEAVENPQNPVNENDEDL